MGSAWLMGEGNLVMDPHWVEDAVEGPSLKTECKTTNKVKKPKPLPILLLNTEHYYTQFWSHISTFKN